MPLSACAPPSSDAGLANQIWLCAQFLTALHDLYVNTMSNPFASLGSNITWVLSRFPPFSLAF
jgi:hypothetical protein